jgi:hypothetical protein
MQTQHQRISSTRSGDWLISAMEGTQVIMRNLSKSFSTIAPNAMKVKHVNIPITSGSLIPFETNIDISDMAQQTPMLKQLDKPTLEELKMPKVTEHNTILELTDMEAPSMETRLAKSTMISKEEFISMIKTQEQQTCSI